MGIPTEDIGALYPLDQAKSPLPDLCHEALLAVAEDAAGQEAPPRMPGWREASGYAGLLDSYGELPVDVIKDPLELVRQMSRDLLGGAVNWRSPELQYNLGAAVNVVASAMYALALDVNVYLINDGLAGNAVVAEQAVGRILAGLAGADPTRARGVFTFGGTGTMAYAIKAGIRKAAPESVARGVPPDLRVVVTEDAHFSHATAADWLGLGSDQLIIIPPTEERRSDLAQAERLLREQLDAGARIATIINNGGTTYDHAIDDIAAFADLRDRLAREYQLPYQPHLHVDSVVGWVWLTFQGHNFDEEDLGVSDETAGVLRRQYQRIAQLHRADSWGVDFHKGIGGCPVDCSFVQFNDHVDLIRLKRGGPGLHQLAEEFSDLSPVDYTLETSRAGGKALAALACLHSLGRKGYQQLLARLMEGTLEFRRLVDAQPDLLVLNPHALGYQTMVRLMPPWAPRQTAAEQLLATGDGQAQLIRDGNTYLKAFFTWDNETRMNPCAGGVVYSFSSKYVETASGPGISGLKFYPTSPHVGIEQMRDAVQTLAARKALFDQRWTRHGR